MAVKIRINSDDINVNVKETVKINITNSKKQILEFQLMMRKALNGDLLIFDHSDIDIVVMTEKKSCCICKRFDD